jgi:hypothetical protein
VGRRRQSNGSATRIENPTEAYSSIVSVLVLRCCSRGLADELCRPPARLQAIRTACESRKTAFVLPAFEVVGEGTSAGVPARLKMDKVSNRSGGVSSDLFLQWLRLTFAIEGSLLLALT